MVAEGASDDDDDEVDDDICSFSKQRSAADLHPLFSG